MQAYQVLAAGGVPDDHIVVMVYDDIASSIENPHKGQVFNRPGGPDVYKGMPKVHGCSPAALHVFTLRQSTHALHDGRLHTMTPTCCAYGRTILGRM
jgi:Peptidase C13 family